MVLENSGTGRKVSLGILQDSLFAGVIFYRLDRAVIEIHCRFLAYPRTSQN